MILNAYALLDMKAGAFAPPFFMHHDAQAVRAVTELGQDMNTTVGRYPSDFALCRIGVFNDQSGQLAAESMVVNLGTIASFLPSRPQLPLFQPPSFPNGAEGPSVGVDANGEVM